jgi:uncharacterized membrane protein
MSFDYTELPAWPGRAVEVKHAYISGMHYFPITLPFVLIFALLLVFLIILVEVRILRYAYQRIGVGQRHMFALLALSFLGGYVNIPLWHLQPHPVLSGGIVCFYGMSYCVPSVTQATSTTIAVNLGGAIVPTFLSLYLLVRNRLYRPALLGVAIVTACVHLMAQPVHGVGIAVPTLAPPLIAAAVGILLSRPYAPPLAYISGCLGTLIGADLLNIGKVQSLGAPVASIGGAGTFDGIFLTGILSVLLAGLVGGRAPSEHAPPA